MQKDITVLLQNLLSLKKHSASSLPMYPAREWLAGLLVAILLLLLGSLYAGYFFWAELMNEASTEVDGSEMALLKEELIREVIEVYKTRAAEFEALQGEGRGDVQTLRNHQTESVSVPEGSLNAE